MKRPSFPTRQKWERSHETGLEMSHDIILVRPRDLGTLEDCLSVMYIGSVLDKVGQNEREWTRRRRRSSNIMKLRPQLIDRNTDHFMTQAISSTNIVDIKLRCN